MSSRTKATRSKTGSRRSHQRVHEPRLCDEGTRVRHRAGADGMYRGRTVFKTKTKVEKETDTKKTDEKATTIEVDTPALDSK